MKNKLFIFLFLISVVVFSQKTYQKKYFDNGNLKEEGWIKNSFKTNYWKFYYKNGHLKKEGNFKENRSTKYWYFYRKNGTLEKEGHFVRGKKSKWWLFYDIDGFINHKCQLKNNQKNGYCLRYNQQELVKAEKYQQGKKIKEWTNLASFKKENNLFDLR